ncbi:MAG TPA: hypothetical protein VFX23_09150, partial [Limnobacter sp.]
IEAAAKTIEQLVNKSKAVSSGKPGNKAMALAGIMVGAVEAGARWWIQHPETPIQDMQGMIEQFLMPGLTSQQLKL